MIRFQRVVVSGFLNIGEEPEEIRLDDQGLTLVTGENGSGKSTRYSEALVWGLFGKTVRDVSADGVVCKGIPKATVEVYFSIEGLIHHFEKIMTNRGHQPPIGEAYGAVEAPNGELGFYLVSDGGNAAYRARCRPPSFMNYQVFPVLLEGHQISDVVAILGSLNIIAAELDR